MSRVLLGTILLEPNRWGAVDPGRRATIRLAEWLDRVAGAGFDGIELWEPHLVEADEGDARDVLHHPLGVDVFNSYVSFDDPDDHGREEAAAWVRRSGARGVKWNTGTDRDAAALDAYAARAARMSEQVGEASLICECHDGTAADDPAVAARVLAAAGPSDRIQALVHTHNCPELLRARFDAYGDRITHVHINHLPVGQPPLADHREEFAATVTLLRELGFEGTWTLEFVHGIGRDHDQPGPMLAQATADLAVAREILG